MATIKIKFRSSSVAGKEGTLCYQVIHGRQTRLISTGYKLHLYEWDKEAGKIRSVKGNPDRERYLEALRFRMEEDQKRLNGIIRKLEQSGKLSSEQIVLAYHSPEGHDDCFFV
ncbi:site-specific integrase, partial [Phocaeicola vulgatus]